LYSEQFDDAAWSKGSCTITANNTVSPDGTQNADLLIANNGINACDLRTASSFSITNGASYTWSLYVKSAGYRYFQMTAWTADDPLTIYDLTNISVVSESGPSHTSTITDVGNGWRRITITRTSTATAAWLRCSPLANSTATAPQNGTDGAYIWGAQVEQSSYPTSYIPTTSASATRVKDNCLKTGVSSLIGQSEGTVFVNFKINGQSFGEDIYSNNKNLTGSISIQVQTNGQLAAYICYSGTFIQIASSTGVIQIGQTYKVAIAYKTGDSALYLNGVQIGTSTTAFAFTTTLSEIDIANDAVFFANLNSKNINQVVQFKTRLTNAELASLTTI
jgi:hypothetical protein